jgi:CRISPR-associated protein Cas6
MVDVAFALEGRTLPADYRAGLAEALARALPWLAGERAAGVHRLNLVRGGGDEVLVSPRTRLMLRVPRAQADAACALEGAELQVGRQRLRVGRAQVRELLPYGTIYAHFVAAASDDEAAFIAALRDELDTLEVRAQPVCGRWQSREGRVGCGVMLSGLAAAQSLRVMEQGLGPHRLLGCGLFVPHKSAAAVGVPD